MSTPSLELPVVAEPAHTSRHQGQLELAERDRLIRRAKALSWLSLAYMTARGRGRNHRGDPRQLRRAARLRP